MWEVIITFIIIPIIIIYYDVTCLALNATFEFSILLSCVSSLSMTMSSSANVGSLPHSWSYNVCNVFFNTTSGLRELLNVCTTAPKSLEWRPYYEHSDQDILLGNLGMGEDVLQHRTHVRFVLLSQVDDTLVIVSCFMNTITLVMTNETKVWLFYSFYKRSVLH